MDNVHRPSMRKWISGPIKIKEYFQEYKTLLTETRAMEMTALAPIAQKQSLDERRRLKIKKCVEGQSGHVITADMFEDIEALCTADSLRIPEQLDPMTLSVDHRHPAANGGASNTSTGASGDGSLPQRTARFRATPAPDDRTALQLETLNLQKQFLDKATRLERTKRQRTFRHLNNNWFESAPPRPDKLITNITDHKILLVVRVYRPYKGSSRTTTVTTNQLRYSQEIHLLADNFLTELRDFIKCPTDFWEPGDVSNDPDKPSGIMIADDGNAAKKGFKRRKANDIYKSGFFYMEGCFYNDMRWPECHDYSEVIRQWSTNSRRGIGPFRTAKMEETKFEDLTVRLGYPYVYVHQGCHEHLFSINSIRLLSADDPQQPGKYPYERSVGMRHSRYCMNCSSNIAQWVTKDNERVPEDPFFFCDDCFRTFNYDKNGIKIGNFKAYPFVDVNAV